MNRSLETVQRQCRGRPGGEARSRVRPAKPSSGPSVLGGSGVSSPGPPQVRLFQPCPAGRGVRFSVLLSPRLPVVSGVVCGPWFHGSKTAQNRKTGPWYRQKSRGLHLRTRWLTIHWSLHRLGLLPRLIPPGLPVPCPGPSQRILAQIHRDMLCSISVNFCFFNVSDSSRTLSAASAIWSKKGPNSKEYVPSASL